MPRRTGRMEEELSGDATVIATGGLANLIARESRQIMVVEPFFTLEGLRIIHALNKAESGEKGSGGSAGRRAGT